MSAGKSVEGENPEGESDVASTNRPIPLVAYGALFQFPRLRLSISGAEHDGMKESPLAQVTETLSLSLPLIENGGASAGRPSAAHSAV